MGTFLSLELFLLQCQKEHEGIQQCVLTIKQRFLNRRGGNEKGAIMIPDLTQSSQGLLFLLGCQYSCSLCRRGKSLRLCGTPLR